MQDAVRNRIELVSLSSVHFFQEKYSKLKEGSQESPFHGGLESLRIGVREWQE